MRRSGWASAMLGGPMPYLTSIDPRDTERANAQDGATIEAILERLERLEQTQREQAAAIEAKETGASRNSRHSSGPAAT